MLAKILGHAGSVCQWPCDGVVFPTSGPTMPQKLAQIGPTRWKIVRTGEFRKRVRRVPCLQGFTKKGWHAREDSNL